MYTKRIYKPVCLSLDVGKSEAERTPVHANPGVGSAMTLNLAAENTRSYFCVPVDKDVCARTCTKKAGEVYLSLEITTRPEGRTAQTRHPFER